VLTAIVALALTIPALARSGVLGSLFGFSNGGTPVDEKTMGLSAATSLNLTGQQAASASSAPVPTPASTSPTTRAAMRASSSARQAAICAGPDSPAAASTESPPDSFRLHGSPSST
jgi:hypothetical protein